MPLSFTGNSAPNPDTGGRNYQGVDTNTGRIVTVQASAEVIRDYGEQAIERKASEKHDAGQLADNVLMVHTSDFT